jgi:DNA-binding GntR family transcriptional regulator
VVQAIMTGDAAAAHASMLHHVSLVEDAFDAYSIAARQAGV